MSTPRSRAASSGGMETSGIPWAQLGRSKRWPSAVMKSMLVLKRWHQGQERGLSIASSGGVVKGGLILEAQMAGSMHWPSVAPNYMLAATSHRLNGQT